MDRLFLFFPEHDILPGMGFTKKQRREQKKQRSLHINYKKRRSRPIRPPEEHVRAIRPQQTMILVKTSWAEPAGDSQEQFQLIKLATSTTAEQVRQEIVNRLHSQGKAGCTVEIFDPDNVPPGTIPDHVRILPG
jgi:hypothetical protein